MILNTAVFCFSYSGAFTKCVETVILQMSTQCPELGHTLVRQFLGHTDEKAGNPWMCANFATTATVELLYRLCTTKDDECTPHR